MITPDEYEALRKQNSENKADKMRQFAQDNLEKFIDGTDRSLKRLAEANDKYPHVHLEKYLKDDTGYAYAICNLIAKEYAKNGWYVYDNTISHSVYIRMGFSRKRLWWRRAWAKPGV